MFVSEVLSFLETVTSTLSFPYSLGWFSYCVNQPAHSWSGCCVLSTVLGAEPTGQVKGSLQKEAFKK